MVYEDLPAELQGLFLEENVAIPEIIRHLIYEGWSAMTSSDKGKMRGALSRQRRPYNRVLLAARQATVALLSQAESGNIDI